MNNATVAPTRTEPVQRAQRKSLAGSTAGQLLEWYEWSAYAVFAPFIARAMFNPQDTVSGLLGTLAVFAVGFLFRPLGGMLFGVIADKKGRKFVLMTTMITMAIAAVAIGLLPTYGQIGIWASVLLLVLRIIQGLAHGGESAAANAYMAEIAPRNGRGFYGSFIFVAIFGGSVLAYFLGGLITTFGEDTWVAEWGWRIPFLLGAVLGLVALWMRRGMAESAVFEVVEPVPAAPTVDAPRPRSQVRNVLLVIFLVAGGTAAHYTWSSYASTYAIVQKGMAPETAYWMLVFAQVLAVVSVLFWGRMADKWGRRKPLMLGATAIFILTIPLKSMITDEGWTLFVASAIALFFVGATGAPMAAIMSETFPTAQRTKLIGIAYSTAVAVFGGSAPYLNQLFISWDREWLASVYLMVLAALTFLAVKWLPERNGVDLNEVR